MVAGALSKQPIKSKRSDSKSSVESKKDKKKKKKKPAAFVGMSLFIIVELNISELLSTMLVALVAVV